MTTTISLLLAIISLLNQVNQPNVPQSIKLEAYQVAAQASALIAESNQQVEVPQIQAIPVVEPTTTQATTTEATTTPPVVKAVPLCGPYTGGTWTC